MPAINCSMKNILVYRTKIAKRKLTDFENRLSFFQNDIEVFAVIPKSHTYFSASGNVFTLLENEVVP